MTQTRRPTDATLRNIRATRTAVKAIRASLNDLKRRVVALERKR